MAINRVEIKDFLVFNGEFAADFCPGINVLIGGNGTGKTTLLKLLYVEYKGCFAGRGVDEFIDAYFGATVQYKQGNVKITPDEAAYNMEFNIPGDVYIPEKDILEHSKGLLLFIEQKPTGFSQIYKDAIVSAQDIPIKNQTETQKRIGEKITSIIGGYIEWVQSEGAFYTIRTDGMRIPFAVEASGFKKLGFLGLLVASGQLEPGAVLFWDEPENSLNPELIPILVDILLELSRNEVQIFLATHSEILASYFAIDRKRSDAVVFHSLYRDSGFIRIESGDRFDLLDNNMLSSEPVKLYRRQLERGLSGNG